MKMNAWTILICFISLCAESEEISKGVHKAQCLKDMGLTKAKLKKLKKSNTRTQSFRLKCYYRCILEKDHLIADNKIIPGAFERIVGPWITCRNLAQVESSCHQQIMDPAYINDQCDFGTIIYKCYNEITKWDLQKCRKAVTQGKCWEKCTT